MLLKASEFDGVIYKQTRNTEKAHAKITNRASSTLHLLRIPQRAVHRANAQMMEHFGQVVRGNGDGAASARVVPTYLVPAGALHHLVLAAVALRGMRVLREVVHGHGWR